MLYLALSCLQGRPMRAAFDALASLSPDGIQLTPGNHPEAGFEAYVSAHRLKVRRHHGFCFEARRTAVWAKGACLVDSESVHPPKAPDDLWWQRFMAKPQDWPILETMYPGYALGDGPALERAMALGYRLAVDVSHIHIQRSLGCISKSTQRRLFDYDRIAEVHVSANAGDRDSHQPLTRSSFGLAWAQEKLRCGAPVVLESYMHRLTEGDRRAQLDLLRGGTL